MIQLHELSNSSRGSQKLKRVGRGPGTGHGKTSGRGHKGAGSRSGYKRRYGKEGGQLSLFLRLPTRGFSNARFRKEFSTINLRQIEEIFEDGDMVNEETLRERGYLGNKIHGLKILADGELTKKVTIQAHAFSKGAVEKLEKASISFEVIQKANQGE